MKKRIFAVFAMCLILITCGCVGNQARDSVSLLGADDAELVSARGDGEPTSYALGGEQVIQQRKYKEKLFGLDAQVEYLFSDSGFINQIVATFPEVSEQELISAVSGKLGEPTVLQEQSDELDFMARWEADGVAYISRRIPNASLYILMEKL